MSDLREYIGILEDIFGDSAMVVLILQVARVVYPMLASRGIALEAPIAILVQDKLQLRSIMEILNIFGEPKVKSLTVPPKEFVRSISQDNYGLVLIKFAEGRYTDENLQAIVDKCAESDNDQMPVLFAVLSVGGITGSYADYFSGFIYLQSKEYFEITDVGELVIRHVISMIVDTQSYQQYQIQNYLGIIEESELAIFLIAAEYLKDFIRIQHYNRYETDDLERKIDSALESISSEWSCPDNLGNYVEAFRKLLVDATAWLPPHICETTALEGIDIERIDQTIFYDDKYYYIKHSDFCDICKPLTYQISINYLKAQLVAAGVLSSEGGNRNYRTIVIDLVTVYGYIIKKRMIKVRRSCIDRDGEPTILDLLDMKGGENHASCETWKGYGNIESSHDFTRSDE